MPNLKPIPRLETLSFHNLSHLCALVCTKLEEASLLNKSNCQLQDLVQIRKSELLRFLGMIRSWLPGPILEQVLPQVLKLIAAAVRKNRSHKGLLKALECLLPAVVKRLDLGALFSEVRLYGEVNTQVKMLLRSCLQRMPQLTHLNLESKCNDDMLVELARHCHALEDLRVPMSDISDRGLMALCGVSVNGAVGPGDGCFNLCRIGLHHCINITVTGVGCLLRNLPRLVILNYDKTLDAMETVAKIDGDYISGRKKFRITHLDQFSDFYEFDGHPEILTILLRVCPALESLRFYISDEGCKNLSLISGIRHLQLEMDDIGNGFRLLTRQYSNMVSLHLTFRTMPFSQLIDIADNCPRLQVLRLMGFEISESHNLVSHTSVFSQLRAIDLRMVRNEDLYEDEPMDLDVVDTITTQLMHFLLDFSHNLEELTVQAVANFMGDRFLTKVFAKNPLRHLKKLHLSVNPSQTMNVSLAKRLIECLPELNLLGLSRWNISNKEMKALLAEVRKKNYDVTFA